MKKTLLILSVLALFASACTPENKPEGDEATIIGEWSMGRMEASDGSIDIRMHLSVSKDGKFVLSMPAWLEQRAGTYEIKDDVITLTCNELIAVFIKPGYRNVYEQYLPFEYSEAPEPPTFDDWAEHWKDEVVMTVKFRFAEDGLHLDGIFGMPEEEPWFADPKFDVVAESKKHLYF